jgi:restriction endonuclease Mrr
MDITVCPDCGWWLASKDTWDSSCGSVPDRAIRCTRATGAALQRYGSGPTGSSLEQLRDEIELHVRGKGNSDAWAAMEDATLAILNSMGYHVVATTRTKDGGVDVLLEHTSFGRVCVQVKHSKNKIGVRVLRELIGTMCIHSANDGLLVTSSAFTRGTEDERDLAQENAGRVIELVDGRQFLAALNLTSRDKPPTLDEIAAVAEPSVEIIYGETHLDFRRFF